MHETSQASFPTSLARYPLLLSAKSKTVSSLLFLFKTAERSIKLENLRETSKLITDLSLLFPIISSPSASTLLKGIYVFVFLVIESDFLFFLLTKINFYENIFYFRNSSNVSNLHSTYSDIFLMFYFYSQ